MNEPDEDLESTLPEEPLPERDALLEALVDAESETAPRRRISKTLIAACVLSGLGVWQIVHVSNGGEPIFQIAPKAKAAPTKLRSDGRVPLGKVLPSTDPIAAYLDRAKRGMTDQEIRWMIEDFQAAGLDEKVSFRLWLTGALPATLRAKQQLWYLEALTEALQLSPEQRAQAKTRMDELHATDVEMIDKEAANYPASKDNSHIRMAIESISSGGSASWLSGDGYAPWNLCDLTKEQLQLTLQRWRPEKKKEIPPKADAEEVDPFAVPAEISWINPNAIEIQDPVSGNLIELPQIDVSPADAVNGTIPDYINISDAFPLTPDQKLADYRYDPLAQARLLQPAQLRMGLLLDPGLVDDLVQRLDSPTTQQTSTSDPGVIVEKPEALPTITITPTDELPPHTVEPETPVDPLPAPDPK